MLLRIIILEYNDHHHNHIQLKRPLRSNAAITNLFHSSLLYSTSNWSLFWSTLRSFITESFHLVLSLPRGLLPVISAIRACLIIQPSALHTCPNRIFGLPYSTCNSLLCLLSNCSVSLLYRGPYIFLIFFFQRLWWFPLVVDHVSHPYVRIGLM